LHSQEELDRVAAELNGRPRKTLKWRKPIEAFNDFVSKRCVGMITESAISTGT
jgi:IS30 family transposase